MWLLLKEVFMGIISVTISRGMALVITIPKKAFGQPSQVPTCATSTSLWSDLSIYNTGYNTAYILIISATQN